MQDLLFLAQRIPYPPDKGDKLRSFHILRHLARHWRVHLGCFVDDPADWRHADEVKRMVASSCILPLDRRRATLRGLGAFLTGEPLGLPYYRDRGMARWVRRAVAELRPAAAYIFSSQMAQYLIEGPRPPRVVMDFCDVDSQKWAQFAKRRQGLLRWVYGREATRLLAFERRVAAVADSSLFVSKAECELFRSLAPEAASRIHVVANGIDTDYFSPDRPYPCPYSGDGPVAVFTGAMDYWPNIEAVTWFTHRILPILRRRHPLLRLAVVGSNPAPQVTGLASPGVLVTGRVPDVRPWIAHASVVVAPILTARGVQNKVLEGMAMARPVVATSQAHEGIDALPGRDLVVADGPEAFAQAVLDAIGDPAGLGAADRRRTTEAYEWENRFDSLAGLL